MKNKFFEYFGYSEEEMQILWDNCIFTFDTNFLLNMYRYSDETKDTFFKIFDVINDRLWLTNRVVNEFFENRLKVIKKQNETYSETINMIDNLIDKLNKKREHPFIDENIQNKFSEVSEELKEELKKRENSYIDRLNNDDIVKQLEIYFDNKVSDGFKNETLETIFEEGENRYKEKVPPGYEDYKKGGNKDQDKQYTFNDKLRIYGDLILWKEIIEKSKNNDCHILFITGDEKDDWWLNFEHKTIQPRPELLKEFNKETNNLFYMYKPERFLQFGSEKYLNVQVDDDTYDEVRNVDEFVESTFPDYEIDNAYTKLTKYQMNEFLKSLYTGSDKYKRDFLEDNYEEFKKSSLHHVLVNTIVKKY